MGQLVQDILVKPLSIEAKVTADLLNEMIQESHQFLKKHPMNIKRISESNTLYASLSITLIGGLLIWPLALISIDFSRVDLMGVLVFAVAGILAPGLGRLFYFAGIERLGASITASVWATFPLYTTLSAVFFLDETLSMVNWMGIVLIVGGVFILERNSKNQKAESLSFSKRQLIIPIIGTLFMASASVLRKYGLNFYNEPILGTAIGYGSSLIIYLRVWS